MATKLSKSKPVLIVGAGPVGLLIALALGQSNIPTLVLEAQSTLPPTTRAMVYMPLITPVLRSLNLLSIMKKEAYLNHEGVVWRSASTRAFLARLRLESLGGEDGDDGEFAGSYHMGQARMNAIVLEEIKKFPSVEVRFGHRCVGIEDVEGAESIKIMVREKKTGDDVMIEGSYVLGTDGGNSTVRGMLCIPFEGFSYRDFKVLGTDVMFDFTREKGWGPLNFFVGEKEWAVVAYTGENGDGLGGEDLTPQWRVAFGDNIELSDERPEVLKRAKERLTKFIGSEDFKIVRADSYWLHQRCAAQGRKGRVLLAGDALHSNNPIGGLGLTTGILDAHVYANALIRVLDPSNPEPDSLLTDCASSRRQAWLNATNPASMANLNRLRSFEEKDVEIREEFFRKLNDEDMEFWKVVRKGMDGMFGETFKKGG